MVLRKVRITAEISQKASQICTPFQFVDKANIKSDNIDIPFVLLQMTKDYRTMQKTAKNRQSEVLIFYLFQVFCYQEIKNINKKIM